jgi:F0F1-type ATP synthase assembly protein I
LTHPFFAVKTAASLAFEGKRLQIAALAIDAVLAPVLTCVLGAWLDRKYGWSPYALLGGLVIGGIGSVQLLREVIRRMETEEKSEEKKDE